MIEQIKPDNKPVKKKYHCCYDYEYDHYDMCQFITRLGEDPEKYEIISLSVNNNGRYELFYKEYID